MNSLENVENKDLIFGKDNNKGIVACEIVDNYVVCLTNEEEQVHFPLVYWVLTNKPTKRSVKLEGRQHYQHLNLLKNKEERNEFIKQARKKRIDCYTIYNEIEANMIYYGFTYYKDIKISDVSVVSFDIEANSLVKNKNSKTFVITNTFRDRQGNVSKKQFRVDNYTNQGEMIDSWCNWVREVDPDILTGHNLNGYDLPYLDHCSDEGLSLGRDDSLLTFRDRASKYRVDGSQTWDYHKVHCYGRNVIDGMFLAVKYDIGKNYTSWGLKAIADYEGWVTEDRQFYDASQIGKNWDDPVEREKIVKYCEDDSDDSLRVFDLMAPSFFYMCQSIPKPFQLVSESASGSWLNSILVRAYLQQGMAIPKANEDEYVGGGMSWGNPGYYTNVSKWDAKSFYPSTVIAFELYDRKKDPEGYYLEMVKYFTNRRFDQKRMHKETGDQYYDDLQASSKVFINSAYGLMGTKGLNFNNYSIAQDITRRCRKGLQKCIVWATGKDVDEWWGVKEPLYKQVTFKHSEHTKYKLKYGEFIHKIKEDLAGITAYVPAGKSGKEWKVCYRDSKACKQDFVGYTEIDTKARVKFEDMPRHDWVLVNIDTDSLSFAKQDGSEFSEEEFEMIFKEINDIMYSEWEDDGQFDQFLVIKAKNYVMKEKGKEKIKYKGSSLTDQKKEPALTQMLKDLIDDIMNNDSEGCGEIYNNYIKEVVGIEEMDRWAVKKSITASVLNPERLQEQKVLDALKGRPVQEGDKVYVIYDVDGEKQKVEKGEPVFLKNGEPKMVPNNILRLLEDYSGTYDKLHYLNRVYSTVEILETVLDKKQFTKYTKSKLSLLEELS